MSEPMSGRGTVRRTEPGTVPRTQLQIILGIVGPAASRSRVRPNGGAPRPGDVRNATFRAPHALDVAFPTGGRARALRRAARARTGLGAPTAAY